MKKLRVGIMSFAHVHAPLYLSVLLLNPDVEVVGLADDDEGRRLAVREAYDVPIFESYESLLEAQLDCVIVCSENAFHKDHVILAASSVKYILCEKPMATNQIDAEIMQEACSAHGAELMVAFPMRHSAPIVEAKGMVDSGRLGHVVACEGVNQGQLPLARRSWFVDPRLSGGGAVIDHTVHVADALRWMLDDEVVEVYAQSNRIVAHDLVTVETSGLVMLTFKGGTVATVDCSWNRPASFPAWGGLMMTLTGESGSVEVDAYSQRAMSYQDDSGRAVAIDFSVNSYHVLLAHFLAVARGETAPSTSGDDGVRSAMIVDAAYESIKTGRPVLCG